MEAASRTHSEDSGEAERWFRREAERQSGITRTPSERSEAGIPILQEVFGFVKEKVSEA
jgi:hypothetical protein